MLRHKLTINKGKADSVRWDRSNGIFADVLLRADESEDVLEVESSEVEDPQRKDSETRNGIPIGPLIQASRSSSRNRDSRKSVLFPAHRAMLLRSDYFLTMFSSAFREAQTTEHLQIISIDCSPEVLEVVLKFLYIEKTDFPLGIAIDVLFAADLLLIEKLKMKAAVVISTLGNGSMSQIPARLDAAEASRPEEEYVDIYDVVRAGWLTRVPRLEEFGARYLAYRLESYIDEDDFADLVRESANKIKGRQETDTIELLDECVFPSALLLIELLTICFSIRYYLSERFRLRFEDVGLEDMMEEEATVSTKAEPNPDGILPEDVGVNVGSLPNCDTAQGDVEFLNNGAIRTLDGEMAGDELEGDSINYQILLGKIDGLLDRLKLDA